MDPFSVLGVMNSALTTGNTIATLIKACCEARGDLKKAKKQVKGLQSVLDKLKSMENVGSTQKGISKALKPCGKILSDIDILLEGYVNTNVRWAVFGKAKLEELQQRLEISKTTLSLYSNTAIINSLGGLGKRINNLENKTDSIGRKVTGIEKQMDTVRKKVTGIERKTDGIEKKTSGIEKRMAGIEKRMTGIERKTDGMEKKVTGMEKKVTGMEKKTDRMEKKMTGVENKMDGVGKKIDGVEKKVNGMEKKIDALDDMKKKVDAMEKQLAAIFNARRAQQDGVKRGKPNVNVVEEGSAQSRPKTQQIPTSRSLTDVCIRIKATCSTIESLQKRRSARDDLKSTNDKLTQLSELITQYAAMDDRSSPSSSTSHRDLVAVDTATDKSINIISGIDIILYNYAYMIWSWDPEGKDMMAKQWQDLESCTSDWERITETLTSHHPQKAPSAPSPPSQSKPSTNPPPLEPQPRTSLGGNVPPKAHNVGPLPRQPDEQLHRGRRPGTSPAATPPLGPFGPSAPTREPGSHDQKIKHVEDNGGRLKTAPIDHRKEKTKKKEANESIDETTTTPTKMPTKIKGNGIQDEEQSRESPPLDRKCNECNTDEKTLKMKRCGHRLCKKCIRSKLEEAIPSPHNRPKCCGRPISLRDVESYVDDELKQRYNQIWGRRCGICTQEGCGERFWTYDVQSRLATRQPTDCTKCKLPICNWCEKAWHTKNSSECAPEHEVVPTFELAASHT